MVAVAWRPVDDHLDAAAFLLRFEGPPDRPAEGIATWGERAVSVHDFEWEHGPAKLYLPDDTEPPALVLVHGIHARGIDEPRLRAFARAMASAGIAVMTPEIEELTDYRIEAGTIERLGDAARAMADRMGRERVALVGISFSGGLALMAASRDAGDGAIGMVLSLGGHHDLLRTGRFYVSERVEGPDGSTPDVDPHPYGAGVLIHAYVDELFPPEDVDLARDILLTLLHDEWREARERVDELSEAGRPRLRAALWSDDPGRDELGEALVDVLEDHRGELASVSPRGSLSGLDVPVYLMHGADDPVVPSIETRWLAREVPDDALEGVLITDALRHAEYEREPTLAERWDLVHFMARVLGDVRSLD